MEIILQDYIDVINDFVDNVERIAEKKCYKRANLKVLIMRQ
jgi:hypothetical protein